MCNLSSLRAYRDVVCRALAEIERIAEKGMDNSNKAKYAILSILNQCMDAGFFSEEDLGKLFAEFRKSLTLGKGSPFLSAVDSIHPDSERSYLQAILCTLTFLSTVAWPAPQPQLECVY